MEIKYLGNGFWKNRDGSKLAETNSNNNNHNWPPNLSKERFLGRNSGFLRDLLCEPPGGH